MLKKVLIAIAILALPTFTYFAYKYYQNQQLPDFDIYRAIPLDASIIIESNNFVERLGEIQSENKIWTELMQFPSVKELNNDIDFIKNLSANNQLISDLTKDKQVVITAHKLGKANLGFIFFIRLQNFRDKKYLIESIGSLIGKDISTRNYNNARIYTVKTTQKELNFSFNKGALMMSQSSILVENAIRQSDVEESILDDIGFEKVQKTSGKNVAANIYINLSNFNQVVCNALNEKQNALIKNMANLGNWVELDVNLKDDAVLLNGFSFSNDSLNNYLNIFLKQNAIDHKMNTVLPSNTSLFVSFGISNTEQYLKSYKQYLEKRGKINNYQLFIDQYKNKYAINWEDFLKTHLDEELGLVITDSPNGSTTDNSFVLMRINSRSITEKEIENFVTKIAQINNTPKSNFIGKLRIDKETTFKVYNLPISNFYNAFFGKIFPDFKNPEITFIDNFMIIGNSKNALSQFVHSNILQQTLENDIRFDRFSDYLSSKSNFYFYTNLFRSPHFIATLLNKNLQKGLNDNIESIQKFQALAVQFQQNNGMIYNNIYLQYIPEIKEEAITVWESHLDTTSRFKPVLVQNHYSKENEIFVQDLDNKIYLINKVGRILWKQQLNEKINSEIYQVDFYKNGKLQLLFSTENKIHLIDRNGNYVERYPVKLRSPSTAGLAMFDYENNKDYRIFIPCQNKNVYLYNIEGALINGWDFKQTDHIVETPVQYFRVKTNDYIVFADKNRTYILNRKGDERINLKEQFAKSSQNGFILDNRNDKPCFVTTDTAGLVKSIYLDGTIETNQVGNYSANHFFDSQDINADGFNDFIFLDKNKLEVLKPDGSKIFDYKFDEKIDSRPIYYYFSYDDRKLGLVSRTTNEIFLLNSNGTLYDGFPLKGSTPFTIGYLENTRNQFNLIVGSKYNFLYNYSVN